MLRVHEARIKAGLDRLAPILAYLRDAVTGTVLEDLGPTIVEMESAIDDLEAAILHRKRQ